MKPGTELAAELGLGIERDSSPLQRGIPGVSPRRLLAKIHPKRKIITLFVLNLEDQAEATGREINGLEEETLRHEVYHFLSWQEKTRKGQKWNPRCSVEETAAEAFARGEFEVRFP